MSRVNGSLEDVLHDVLELLVNFLCCPVVTHGVLGHFETGNCNAACVYSLGGSNYHLVLLEVSDSFVCCRHIGNLNIVLHAVCNDLLSLFDVDFVLCSAGHNDVNLNAPRLLACVELSTELVSVILRSVAAGSAHFKHISDLFGSVDAVLVVDVTVGTGDSNYLAAEFCNLECNAPGNVTETGDSNCLALDIVAEVLDKTPKIY